ncbi:MAG: hypothetical protein K8I30_06260 [Anaerolineae bacterium]|nr:hypothetical protein [Anaerolineae bacterium]
MPYQIRWLVENRVIYQRQYGVITTEELYDSNKQTAAMTAAGIRFVHLITDASGAEKNEIGLNDLIAFYKQYTPHENLGWSVYISPSLMNRFFASVVTQITKVRTREFGTLPEGIKFLIEHDDSLPDIPLP